MFIFEKRPLCMILCIMLGSFSLFSALAIGVKFLIAIPLILSAFIVIYFVIKYRKKAIVAVALFSVIFTLAGSVIFDKCFYPSEYYGKTVEIKGYFSEIYETSYGLKSVIKTTTIDNKDASYKILIQDDEHFLTSDDLYREFTLSGRIDRLSRAKDISNTSSLLADGVSAYIGEIKELELSSEKRSSSVFVNMRDAISLRLEKLTNKDAASLLDALLLGKRDSLNPDVTMDFRRIGISHILALSGMHLAILTGAISAVMTILRSNKIKKTIISSLFVIMYMALTGFAASVTRAGLMLLIMNMLFLIRAESDSFTTLSIAVSLIILVSPYSVFDIGLWLSALATLGILGYNEYLECERDEVKPKGWKIAKRIISPFAMSIFAIGFTYFLTVPTFGELSVISLFSTVIFSLIIEIFVYLGLFTLIFGSIIPLGGALSLAGDIICELASLMSSSRWTSVSTGFAAVRIFSYILSVALVLFLILRIKRKRLYLGAVFLLFIATLGVSIFSSYSNIVNERVLYSSQEADSILIVSDKEVTLIYSGSSSRKATGEAIDLLSNERITYIDNIILTDISGSVDSTIYKFVRTYKTGRILMPRPHGEKEIKYAENAAITLSEFSTKLDFYDKNESIRTANVSFTLNERTINSENYTPQIGIYTISTDEKTILFASRGFTKYYLEDFLAASASAHTLVLSSRGSNADAEEIELKLKEIERIICTSAHRLTKQTEDYYKQKGVSVVTTETPINIIR